MTLDSDATEIIDVTTPTGPIKIEVRTTGREKVALQALTFTQFKDTLTAIASELSSVFDRFNPTRTVIEFGVEAALESGGVVAVLVKGSAKANLKITLEWSDSAVTAVPPTTTLRE